MENIINIHLSLLDRVSAKPISKDDISVELYDKDLFKDDFLGQSALDGKGHAIFSIVASDFQSLDSPNEHYPDLYFKVFKGDSEIFVSKVFKNLRIEEANPFPISGGIHFDLGTFTI